MFLLKRPPVALLFIITFFSVLSADAQDISPSYTTKMNVYFISGLGADKRVFSKLQLDDQFSVNYIEWIAPLKKETLQHYASRLVTQIDTTKPFQLVGLSFGGIRLGALRNNSSPSNHYYFKYLNRGPCFPV